MEGLASNKMFIGSALFLMNMGSRFVIGDLPEPLQRLLKHTHMKKIITYCMFFIAIRDFAVAGAMTIMFTVLQSVFSDKSRLNMVPVSLKAPEPLNAPNAPNAPNALNALNASYGITQEEYASAKRVTNLFETYQQPTNAIAKGSAYMAYVRRVKALGAPIKYGV